MLKETLNNSRVALAFKRVCRQTPLRGAVLPLQSGSPAPAHLPVYAGIAPNTVHGAGIPRGLTLTARVEEVLTSDTGLSASHIRVEASGGTVILRGFVDSPADMLRALDLVDQVAGVETVANRLHLAWW